MIKLSEQEKKEFDKITSYFHQNTASIRATNISSEDVGTEIQLAFY
jgi:hypothetical protein